MVGHTTREVSTSCWLVTIALQVLREALDSIKPWVTKVPLIPYHSMSSQQTVRLIPATVAERIRQDFNSNAIKFYRFDEVPEVFIDRQVLNSKAGDKSTCAVVGLSSCPGDERDYVFLSWLRLDVDNKKKEYVTDIDPIAFYYKNTMRWTPFFGQGNAKLS
jgi:hypothetical protein